MSKATRSIAAAGAVALATVVMLAAAPAFAQFQDPSMPLRPNAEQRPEPRREQPERSSPFALPTTALPRSSPQASGEESVDGEVPAIPDAPEYPPYEKEMARLAEILGSMEYLGELCEKRGARWRGEMEALLEAESPTEAWRARLVSSFNSGYRGYERTYRSCTPAAERAVQIYMVEGRELTGTIRARYAN